jgi:hypothetical protein
MTTRLLRSSVLLLAAVLLVPRQAAAQTDGWTVDFAPLYFCATSLDGELGARSGTVPIYLDFSEAKDHLGGAFSFHLEATRGRWGVLSDHQIRRGALRAYLRPELPLGPVTRSRRETAGRDRSRPAHARIRANGGRRPRVAALHSRSLVTRTRAAVPDDRCDSVIAEAERLAMLHKEHRV